MVHPASKNIVIWKMGSYKIFEIIFDNCSENAPTRSASVAFNCQIPFLFARRKRRPVPGVEYDGLLKKRPFYLF